MVRPEASSLFMQPATAREAPGSFISNNTPGQETKANGRSACCGEGLKVVAQWDQGHQEARCQDFLGQSKVFSPPLPCPPLQSLPCPPLPCPPPSPPQPLPCGAGQLYVFSLGASLVLDKPWTQSLTFAALQHWRRDDDNSASSWTLHPAICFSGCLSTRARSAPRL